MSCIGTIRTTITKGFFAQPGSDYCKALRQSSPASFSEPDLKERLKSSIMGCRSTSGPHRMPIRVNYVGFLGAINESKGTRQAMDAALLAGEKIVIAGTMFESTEYFRAENRTAC